MENSNKKMLREIANDQLTPKKYDFKVQNDLYESNHPLHILKDYSFLKNKRVTEVKI